jgi:ribonuclease D
MSKDILVIETTQGLQDFIDEVKDAPFITLDTEFMRERTYYPELCLIQIADDAGHAALIDPLAKGMDLQALAQMLKNKDQMKVLHACRQDMEIFYTIFDAVIEPVFDTQIAAAFLGLGDSVAYRSLVQKYCGEEMSKAQQFTDWSRRPLSDAQKSYALSDVTYLVDIYKAIVDELEQKGRTNWIRSEMETLRDASLYDVDPQQAWERVKIRSYKPKDLMVLKEICAWREHKAQERNVPKAHILKDEVAVQIAMTHPKNADSLAAIRFFNDKRAYGSDGKAILSCVKNALSAPRETWPSKQRKAPPSAEQSAAMEMLKMLLRIVASEHDVTARMLASVDDIEVLSVADISKQPDENLIPAMRGWRFDVFGREALDMLGGRLALTLKDGAIQRHKVEP